MNLYTGEGVLEHYGSVVKAVNLWNESLEGFTQEPVIRLRSQFQGAVPRNYILDRRFWSNPEHYADRLGRDGQSVIYFKSSGNIEEPTYSFAQWRWGKSNRIVEADIFIDTAPWEHFIGDRLVDTALIEDLDGTYGIYALVDSLYLTILHELGHALGLLHSPISGNIMSYNYMPSVVEEWRKPFHILIMSSALGGYLEPTLGLPFVRRMDGMYPLMALEPTDRRLDTWIKIMTESAVLGEQDRTALMCIYEFEDWNH